MKDLNKIYEDSVLRFAFWQKVANDFGDFYIMKSWFVDGSPRFAKWRTVVDASDKTTNYHLQISHRQILPFEICLDMDNKEMMQQAYEFFDRLYDDNVLPEIYLFETGSKGIHIHIFLIDQYKEIKNRREWRKTFNNLKKLISYWGFDSQKASEKVPIALEFAPHWKSGKQKRLIKGRGVFYESYRLSK